MRTPNEVLQRQHRITIEVLVEADGSPAETKTKIEALLEHGTIRESFDCQDLTLLAAEVSVTTHYD